MNLKRGEKVAKYSTYINLFLTVVKGAVGYISGSISLIADAMHSFSDVFSSLAVYLGLKFLNVNQIRDFHMDITKLKPLFLLWYRF